MINQSFVMRNKSVKTKACSTLAYPMRDLFSVD